MQMKRERSWKGNAVNACTAQLALPALATQGYPCPFPAQVKGDRVGEARSGKKQLNRTETEG